MKEIRCPLCGFVARKNGKKAAGSQRWRCKSCSTVFTKNIDNTTSQFKRFLNWLLGKTVQREMPGDGRSFRRTNEKFWHIWPLPPKIENSSKVVFVDGIHLSNKLCVVICCNKTHVLGWYVCRDENSRAWKALLSRIAAPQMVVSDGGKGFKKALKEVWPHTQHQRCLFHAFNQVKKDTTTHPKTPAGRELYELAKELLNVKDKIKAAIWIEKLHKWNERYKDFLSEMSLDEYGKLRPTHYRLVRANKSLIKLVREGTLFTFLKGQNLPPTNNQIEGGVNAQLRSMLRNHKGLPLERRLKAIYWWCYMHSPKVLPLARILDVMPTDENIRDAYRELLSRQQLEGCIPRWGDAVAWSELHLSTTNGHPWD